MNSAAKLPRALPRVDGAGWLASFVPAPLLAWVVMLCLFPFAVRANPIAVADVEKTWERCLVSIDKDFGTVSCAVGYQLKSKVKGPLVIDVPAFAPAGLDPSGAEALRLFLPRIENEKGAVYKPTRIEKALGGETPAGLQRVSCLFVLDWVPPSSFSLVISYRQPLFKGQFYYVPQFEDGAKQRDPKTFNFTAFPVSGASLALHKPTRGVQAALASRITLTPENQSLISIQVK